MEFIHRNSVRFLAVVLLIIMSSCASTQAQLDCGDATEMPSWFWNTPVKKGVRLAVGYAAAPSSPHVSLTDCYDRAFEDGALRLYKDGDCYIKGERATGSGPDGTYSMGEIRDFNCDESGFDSFQSTVSKLDSFQTSDLIVVLVATRDVSVEKKRIPSPPPSQQSEVKASSKGRKVGMAFGKFSFHRYRFRDWQEAEDAARFEVAFSLHSEIQQLQQIYNGRMTNVTLHKTDAVNCRLQSVRRMIDCENKQVWVWVEGRN